MRFLLVALASVIASSSVQALTYTSAGDWDETWFHYCDDCGTTSRYQMTIETDGTLGALSQENIVSWAFEIEGSGSQSEADLGFTRSAVASSLEGASANWADDSRLFATAAGNLSTGTKTDIWFSNVFSEDMKEYDRVFRIFETKMTASTFQYDSGPRDDTFGSMTDSVSNFGSRFVLGNLVEPDPGAARVAATRGAAVGPTGFGITSLAVVPVPPSAGLLLLAAGLLVTARRKRAA